MFHLSLDDKIIEGCLFRNKQEIEILIVLNYMLKMMTSGSVVHTVCR